MIASNHAPPAARLTSPTSAAILATLAGRSPQASELALEAAREYDALERPDRDARQLKKLTLMVASGFSLAVFPYTPGLVANCQPDHNVGWLCGARIAAFVAAVGAVLVGVEAGYGLWQGRGYQAHQARSLGLELGHRMGGGAEALSTGESLMSRYREASLAERDEAKEALAQARLGC